MVYINIIQTEKNNLLEKKGKTTNTKLSVQTTQAGQ